MRTAVFQFVGPRHYRAHPSLTLCGLVPDERRGELVDDGEITSWALPICDKCYRLEAEQRARRAA